MHPELLDQLAATPKRIAQLIVEASELALNAAPAGEWSARTIIAHLRDTESLVSRLRLERMLAEDEPRFAPFEFGTWELGRNRSRDRKEELLADFALQRQASLGLLRALRPEEWARTGYGAEGHQWTVASHVEHWAEHDREHFAALEAALGTTLDAVLRQRYHPET